MSNSVKTKQALPKWIFAVLLVTSVLLATCYGSTFMLADYLRLQGLEPTQAGSVISSGVIVTLICALFAGKLAERIGLIASLAIASVLMGLAMLSFSTAGKFFGVIYVGGILLGAGWAIFYILAPLIVINSVSSTARIKYLTYLSGAQMIGLGLSTPVGNLLVTYGANHQTIYIYLAILAIICPLLLIKISCIEKNISKSTHRLTLSKTIQVFTKSTLSPVMMILLLACIFSGLATFQSLYADTRGFDSSTFFIVFTFVTVILRFGVASQLVKLPIYNLAIGLIILIVLSLMLLLFNKTNPILYIVSSVIFAIGYGLSYSTLNAIVVNTAEEHSLSTSSASQIFTLCYFVGIFGFPFIAGILIKIGTINSMLLMAILIALAALFIGVRLRAQKITLNNY